MGLFTEEILSIEYVLLEKELTTQEREALTKKQFAVPSKEKLPIHDAKHVRNAMARFNQTKDLTSGEKKSAFDAIVRAAKRFGIEVDEFIDLKPS